MLNFDPWDLRLDDSSPHRQIALETIHGRVSRDSPASVVSYSSWPGEIQSIVHSSIVIVIVISTLR